MYFILFEWGSNGVKSLIFLELDFLFFRLRRILELDRWPTVGGLYFEWQLVACGGSIKDNGSAFFFLAQCRLLDLRSREVGGGGGCYQRSIPVLVVVF